MGSCSEVDCHKKVKSQFAFESQNTQKDQELYPSKIVIIMITIIIILRVKLLDISYMSMNYQ